MESIDNAIFGSILQKLSRGRCLDDITVTTSDHDYSSNHTLETLVEEESIGEDEDSISAQWTWEVGSYLLGDEGDNRWEACLEGPVASHPLSCGMSRSQHHQEHRHLVR
jgi:hypothetical protein